MELVSVELHTFQSPKFRSVVEETIGFFERTPVHHLPPPSGFPGGGVYALYYLGDYELYTKIAQLDQKITCSLQSMWKNERCD